MNFIFKGSLVNVTPDQITAYDQDIGINATMIYSLNNPGNLKFEKVIFLELCYWFGYLYKGNLFEINENNGQLRLKNRILDLEKSEYNLIVKVNQIF